MSDSLSPRKTGFLALASISAADCAAHSMNSLGPFAVDELVRTGRLTVARAGIWSSAEMLAYALAMILIASHAVRIRLKTTALIAALLVATAQIVTAFTHMFWGLLLLRLLSGLGLGALNAVVNIGASRLGRPVFILSFVMVVQTIVFSTTSLALPYIAHFAGQKGIFLTFALIILILLPLLANIPPTEGQAAKIGSPVPHGGFSKKEITALLAILCYTGGSLAVWPFTERIATSIGITGPSFGRLSAMANIGGLVLCLLTVRLSRNPRTLRLLVPALVITGVICIIQAVPPLPWLFYAAFLLNYALWFFIYPCLVGLACLVDPSGKLASRSGGAWMISQAGTTLMAGFSGTNGHYGWIGLLSLLLCLISGYCAHNLRRAA